MSNTKFTEGPWKAGDFNEYDGITTITAGKGIDAVEICQVEFKTEEDDHNVNLIEASPLLYKALDDLLTVVSYTNSYDVTELFRAVDAAKEALFSARGKSHLLDKGE